MPKNETLSTRVTRLETAMGEMAEKINILIDAQTKTDRRIEAMNRRTDERINQLVSAIGDLIQRIPPQGLR